MKHRLEEFIGETKVAGLPCPGRNIASHRNTVVLWGLGGSVDPGTWNLLASEAPGHLPTIRQTYTHIQRHRQTNRRTEKIIHTTQPAYLNSVLEYYIPSRILRSSDTNLLSVPYVHTCFGSRSFSVAAPTISNSLPFDIRNNWSIASFRPKLKTFYFSTSSHV